MDGSFALVILVVALVAFAIPIMAIVALVRTASLRKQMEQMEADHRESVHQLSMQIAELRRTRTEAPPVRDAQTHTAHELRSRW